MGRYNFNRRKCIKALIKIGFCQKRLKGRKHDKFFPPNEISSKLKPDQAHFIMIPRHRILKVQELIIDELKDMGGNDLVDKFLNNL